MTFKVGDFVERIRGTQHNMRAGDRGRITSTTSGNGLTIEGFGDGHAESNLKLVTGHKVKPITHIVIWTEQSRDPHRFFTNEPDAREFVKKQSENSYVRDIFFIETKSVSKVKIQKSIRLSEHKI